jgi:hypothetical protein
MSFCSELRFPPFVMFQRRLFMDWPESCYQSKWDRFIPYYRVSIRQSNSYLQYVLSNYLVPDLVSMVLELFDWYDSFLSFSILDVIWTEHGKCPVWRSSWTYYNRYVYQVQTRSWACYGYDSDLIDENLDLDEDVLPYLFEHPLAYLTVR